MFLPDLTPIRNKTKLKGITFTGLNRQASTSDNELSACSNLSFKNKPLLSCRDPRETMYTLTTPRALFSANNKLVTVDGTNFRYDNVVRGAVTASAKSMVDFNGKIVVMPDKVSYDYTTSTFATIGTGVFDKGPGIPSDIGSCPNMDFIAVHDNRAFGVKGNDIHACALGNVTDWTKSDSTSMDSFHTDVASEGGSFTGITSYSNHVVIFKSDLMFELYNSKPPFTVQKVNEVGCISNRAIKEVNSILYFVGRQGVFAYAGGTPRLISTKLNETYQDAVLGSDGKVLYASLYNGSVWNLYVYDTDPNAQAWLKEDETQAVGFTNIGKDFYCLNSVGALQRFNSGTEAAIPYSIETKDFTLDSFNKKSLSKIHIRVELQPGSQMQVYTKVDDKDYSLATTFSAAGLQSFSTTLKVSMADHFKIKISGTGQFKLFAFQKDIIISESEI